MHQNHVLNHQQYIPVKESKIVSKPLEIHNRQPSINIVIHNSQKSYIQTTPNSKVNLPVRQSQ